MNTGTVAVVWLLVTCPMLPVVGAAPIQKSSVLGGRRTYIAPQHRTRKAVLLFDKARTQETVFCAWEGAHLLTKKTFPNHGFVSGKWSPGGRFFAFTMKSNRPYCYIFDQQRNNVFFLDTLHPSEEVDPAKNLQFTGQDTLRILFDFYRYDEDQAEIASFFRRLGLNETPVKIEGHDNVWKAKVPLSSFLSTRFPYDETDPHTGRHIVKSK